MLQIQVNNKFLTLNPGAGIEMQLNSPLSLSDDIYSDFSFGITIPYSENNVRVLGDVFSDDAKLSTFFNAEVYDNTQFLFSCKLVVDKPTVSTKNEGKGYAEGYLLGGLGNFFYDIKFKRVGQLALGGPRNFNFTTWDPYDSSDGIWQHLHATWDGTYDYICLPFINEAAGVFNGTANDILSGWVNRLDFGTLYNGWEGSDGTTIVPGGNDIRMKKNYQPVLSIKVKYIFEQICAEQGWILDSSLLAAENFDKLLMIGNIPIRYSFDRPQNNPVTATINLGNLISPEITCIDFIMQRCRRYGWWADIDADKKILKLVPLKLAGTIPVKDYTAYADPQQQFDASNGARIFSFKNIFPSADNFPSSPSFADFTKGAPVLDAEHLPPASSSYDNFIILCIKENAWYHVVFSEDLPITDPVTQSRKWEWFADNIYDHAPQNTTDTFESKVTPMPLHWSVFRSNDANEIFYGAFLRCNMNVMGEWGMRDVFYFGVVSEFKIGIPLPEGFTYNGQMVDYLLANGGIDKSLTAGPYDYPFASPVPLLPDGTVVGNWANVFKIPLSYKDGAGDDHAVAYKGIVDYWFSPWLKLNSNAITNQVNLNLPLHELLKIQWDAVINIRNIPFLLQKLIIPVPYQGVAKATLQPVILDPNVLNDTNYPYKGPVYLKLVWEDIADYPDETFNESEDRWSYTLSDVKKAVAKLYAYSDEEGTIPIAPNNFAVFAYRKVIYPPSDGSVDDLEPPFLINVNSTVTIISPVVPELYSYNETASLEGSVPHPGQAVYVIQSSSNYQVIG